MPTSFDYEFALRQCSGNHSLTRRLLGKLVDQLGVDLPELVKLIGDGAPEAASRVAHRIKGSAASLGAERIRGCAAAAESRLQTGDAAEAEQLVPELCDAVSAYSREVEELT
jgi:HPt (histidine-containing phosphotransfer) domain-containing protein